MTINRPRVRLSFWMTAFAIPSLIVLIGLGVWQVQRLEWKEAVIADRAERMSAPAVALSAVPDGGRLNFVPFVRAESTAMTRHWRSRAAR